MDTDERDVTELHSAILRERNEPTEGREPLPPWLGVLAIGLVAWGGWYVGRYDAGFEFDRADMQPLAATGIATSSPPPASPSPTGPSEQTTATDAATQSGEPAPAAEPMSLELGAQVYASRCVACHQTSGQGLPAVFPPLVDSDWVTGDPVRLTKIVLHGLSGPIDVGGASYNGAMPAWGALLTDTEVASVVSYVRTSWGNDAGDVTTEDVQKTRSDHPRETPWTASEL